MIKTAYIALISALLLTACFDVSQKFVVDENQLSVQVETGMSTQLASLLVKDAGSDANEWCKQLKKLADVPNLNASDAVSVETHSRFEDDTLYCRVRFVMSIELAKEIYQDAYHIEFLPDNQLRLTSTIKLQQDEERSEFTQFFRSAMAGQIFANRALKWEINALEIVSTNGYISADGKTARWEVPMAVAESDGGSYTFEAVVVYAKPWWRFW